MPSHFSCIRSSRVLDIGGCGFLSTPECLCLARKREQRLMRTFAAADASAGAPPSLAVACQRDDRGVAAT